MGAIQSPFRSPGLPQPHLLPPLANSLGMPKQVPGPLSDLNLQSKTSLSLEPVAFNPPWSRAINKWSALNPTCTTCYEPPLKGPPFQKSPFTPWSLGLSCGVVSPPRLATGHRTWPLAISTCPHPSLLPPGSSFIFLPVSRYKFPPPSNCRLGPGLLSPKSLGPLAESRCQTAHLGMLSELSFVFWFLCIRWFQTIYLAAHSGSGLSPPKTHMVNP